MRTIVHNTYSGISRKIAMNFSNLYWLYNFLIGAPLYDRHYSFIVFCTEWIVWPLASSLLFSRFLENRIPDLENLESGIFFLWANLFLIKEKFQLNWLGSAKTGAFLISDLDQGEAQSVKPFLSYLATDTYRQR